MLHFDSQLKSISTSSVHQNIIFRSKYDIVASIPWIDNKIPDTEYQNREIDDVNLWVYV